MKPIQLFLILFILALAVIIMLAGSDGGTSSPEPTYDTPTVTGTP